MQILKKAKKNNYLADTAPHTKTYDLDKLVQERKHIKNIGNAGFTYECFFCNTLHDTISHYNECVVECFIRKYPCNFIRETHPQLTTIINDIIVWNYDALLEIQRFEPIKFSSIISNVESEIISYGYGDEKVLHLKTNRDNKMWDELVNNVLDKINLEKH